MIFAGDFNINACPTMDARDYWEDLSDEYLQNVFFKEPELIFDPIFAAEKENGITYTDVYLKEHGESPITFQPSFENSEGEKWR